MLFYWYVKSYFFQGMKLFLFLLYFEGIYINVIQVQDILLFSDIGLYLD